MKLPTNPPEDPSVPLASGFRMPAEWEPHDSTWLAWPHQHADWPGKFAPIPWVYGEIIRHLHVRERINLLVNDEKSEEQAARILRRVGVDLRQIRFWHWPTDRVWTRDYGPMFLVDSKGQKAVLNWQFNAWAKYLDWQNDNEIPLRVCNELQYRCWSPTFAGKRIVLEGGSIDVNGQGLLLTTEECLLSDVQSRNPGLSREDLEQVFSDYLDIKKTLWLNRGIAGDDTHGHIDDLARFVGVRTIVTAVEDDPKDENYDPLQENLARLKAMTDLEGRKLEIVPLPMPAPVYFKSIRLPASYANFYIANGIVLVPTFNDPNDRVALGILADLFPERIVAGLHAVELVWGLGTLHCLSQQEPLPANVLC